MYYYSTYYYKEDYILFCYLMRMHELSYEGYSFAYLLGIIDAIYIRLPYLCFINRL